MEVASAARWSYKDTVLVIGGSAGHTFLRTQLLAGLCEASQFETHARRDLEETNNVAALKFMQRSEGKNGRKPKGCSPETRPCPPSSLPS